MYSEEYLEYNLDTLGVPPGKMDSFAEVMSRLLYEIRASDAGMVNVRDFVWLVIPGIQKDLKRLFLSHLRMMDLILPESDEKETTPNEKLLHADLLDLEVIRSILNPVIQDEEKIQKFQQTLVRELENHIREIYIFFLSQLKGWKQEVYLWIREQKGSIFGILMDVMLKENLEIPNEVGYTMIYEYDSDLNQIDLSRKFLSKFEIVCPRNLPNFEKQYQFIVEIPNQYTLNWDGFYRALNDCWEMISEERKKHPDGRIIFNMSNQFRGKDTTNWEELADCVNALRGVLKRNGLRPVLLAEWHIYLGESWIRADRDFPTHLRSAVENIENAIVYLHIPEHVDNEHTLIRQTARDVAYIRIVEDQLSFEGKGDMDHDQDIHNQSNPGSEQVQSGV